MTDNQASKGLGAVAAATGVVFVAGQRVGSAVLVDEWRMLTAGHVLRRTKVGAGVAAPSIEVVFPAALAGNGAQVPVQPVALDASAVTADVAMLELVIIGEPPEWLPAPVLLSPRRRLPPRVSVFGFPREEKALRGVWREFDTAGPAADATVQLDWAGDAGTLPGHSGGPVIDPRTGALVGVLVHGSQAGRFDRFLPLTVISAYCPGLPRPWLMIGADARSHLTRRSRGQRSHFRGGDLFRGRQAALAAVRGWLTDPHDQGRPLVVTGQPGAGKSAVVARAALGLEAERQGPGLAFHALGAVHRDLLTAVADLTGTEHVETYEALLDALDNAPARQLTMIVVDALDEAASSTDRQQIAETLTELATMPRMRVVVATRPLAVDDRDRYRFGGLLPALGITSSDSSALVDLDTDRYFEPAGLRKFAAAVLAQHQAKHPGPIGAAWTTYRADSGLCDRLARMIAARARRNYLVAAMAAIPLSIAEQPVDPAAGFDPASIPSGVGGALAKFLDQLPEPEQLGTRALLTALAYARGSGIDDRTWMAFAGALGYPVTMADLDRLRASIGADYLVQTVTDGKEPLTRLFHQALADELLARRHQSSDERALLSAIRPVQGMTWAMASPYALMYAVDHASSARQLHTLLDDPDYLTHADLTRLPPLLSLEMEEATNPTAIVVRQVATRANPLPPPRRARLLALTAAHFGLPDLRRHLAAVCNEPPIPGWAHSLGIPHRELTGHTRYVSSVAMGRIGDRDVIVSGGGDNTVRVWDAATGRPRGDPLTGHTAEVHAVAMGRIGDRDVIVSASRDNTVRVWDAATGHPLGDPLTGHTDSVRAAAIGPVGDRDVIVSGGGDNTVRVWDAATGHPLGDPLTGHIDQVPAVAMGRIGDRDVIVSASDDNTVRVWDAATGHPLGDPLTGHTNSVWAVAMGRIDGRDVIVSSSWDKTVRVWDAATGHPRGDPLTGHTDFVEAVAIGRIGGRDVIVSGGGDSTVRVWDAATGHPLGDPLTGHTHVVSAVAMGRIGDRDVIVSASNDTTVRVWDAFPSRPPGEPLTGHTNHVSALAMGRIDGRDVIVSGSWDKTVRVWDAATGHPRGDPLTGHTSWVYAVAMGRIDGRDVIVSGGWDNTVRVWDAATGRPRGDPLTGHTSWVYAVAMGRIDGRDVIVSGGGDNTVRVWDAATGHPRGDPLTGHTDSVWAVAMGRVGGRDVIVSGGDDNTVRVWDAATGHPHGDPLTGHTQWVRAVAMGRIDGRDVIVSGSWDNTVRVWYLEEGRSLVMDLLGSISAVALTEDGRSLYAGAGHSICFFQLRD